MCRLPIIRTFKLYNYTVSYYDFETKEVFTKDVTLNQEAKKPEDFAQHCNGRPLEYKLNGIDLVKRGMTYDNFLSYSEVIDVTKRSN